VTIPITQNPELLRVVLPQMSRGQTADIQYWVYCTAVLPVVYYTWELLTVRVHYFVGVWYTTVYVCIVTVLLHSGALQYFILHSFYADYCTGVVYTVHSSPYSIDIASFSACDHFVRARESVEICLLDYS
jgi:hypothetical protein